MTLSVCNSILRTMLSLLIRRAFAALLMVALVGLPLASAPSMAAGVAMSALTMDGAPCDQFGSEPLAKSVGYDKAGVASCAFGVGCLLTNLSAPSAFFLPARLGTLDVARWRVAELGAGRAVAPDFRPPISLI